MSTTIYKQKTDELKQKLINHSVFMNISDLRSLRIFMEVHVFAVWDFMSLAKRLQNELSCTSIPWLPPQNTNACRLINEIILGEECDLNLTGGSISHYELYVNAMKEMGANINPITHLIQSQQNGDTIEIALNSTRVPTFVKKFVADTIQVVQHGSLVEVLGYFFYGREDIIPNMFSRLLSDWGIGQDEAPLMTYYLKRHIELDSDEHGPAVQKIIDNILSDDPTKEVKLFSAAIESIKNRIDLWDGLNEIILTTENILEIS